ncbi:hypothetical protein VN97_g5943 [Penicillium thymicola]|uniref:Uncharacterized protein n=1 Tax=Penicillium thymicola TaxID=293382 RepID=A0AAI9THL6_PENTH|nr:hypothetical protein VN97_g5943 [Penicillium thymicola]
MRKEDTTCNLQDRVHELEDGIEKLSQSFLTFTDLLLETGLLEKQSRITLALHKITQQHLSLAETGYASPHEGEAVGATSSTAFDKNETNSSPRVPSNERAPIGLSSTPMGCSELPSLYPQPPLYQCELTPPINAFMAFRANTSPLPLSSLPGHSPDISLASSIKDQQWTFSQYLVKACCQNGYQLLVNTPSDFVKIQEVFGTPLPPTERKNFISCFHAGMHDKTGNLIDLMATALAPSRPEGEYHTSEGLATPTDGLGSIFASSAGEWLDASGVQGFISAKGFCTQENGRPLSRSFLISSLPVAALIQYLANECICFGHGPAFRRQTVEAALRLARTI